MTASSTLLRLEGRDALAVLHRISTQKLDDIAPGEARVTLFCDYRGRLLHRAVVARTEAELWLVRDDAPGAPLAEHIGRHVFREDVRIEDLSAVHPVTADYGSGVVSGIETQGSVPARIVVGPGLALDVTGREIDPHAEGHRVAAALPRHGHEVSEEFNPFEIGRAHEVHLSKGCFTGQEVLLRLVTYKGQRRHLARVAGEGAPPATPSDLVKDGAKVGRLTSAAAAGKEWIGLAVVSKDLEGPDGIEVVGNGRLTRLEPVMETRPLGLPA